MKYDLLTRLLHLLIAIGASSQTLTSLVMVTPKPGRSSNLWYEIHKLTGIGLLLVVSIFWLWALTRAFIRGDAMMLFPWLSGRRLLDLREDAIDTIKELVHMRLPADDVPRPLPAAVQGLGLLLALFLAGSGTILITGMAPDGSLSFPLHALKELHETAGSLMWAYLIGHPLLGLLHQLAGHGSLNRMFGFR